MLLIEKFTKTLYFIFQTCEYNRTSVDNDIICIDDDDEANFETPENLQTHPDQLQNRHDLQTHPDHNRYALQTPDHFQYDENLQTHPDHFQNDENLQTLDNFQNPKNEVSSDETESSDSSSDSEIEARTTKKKVLLKKSEKNSSNHKTSSSESEKENANSISSLSKKDFVNVKSSKQNKTFSKKLEQNSSDSEDDNDFISESSKNKNQSSEQLSFKEQKKKSKERESNSESSSSEDEQEPITKPLKTKEKSVKENILLNQSKTSNKSSSESETSSSSDEPSRFIKKYFKLFSSKPSENRKKNSMSESSSKSSSSENEQESISEPLKSTKKFVKPSTKEPKKTSSKTPEHYQGSSNIETSASSEDDEQQSISKLSDSCKMSTKNQSCSKSFETPKKAKTSKEISLKTSKEISSKTSSETSSKTSSETSSTTSNETSSSSDDEEKLINEPSSSAKKPMTSSYVKQLLSKPSEGAKKNSSKTPKQISSKTPKQISSKTSKEISSNIESSSSESEEDSIPPPVKPKKIPAKKSTSNQSKTSNEKPSSKLTKNDSEKSYEDFSPILEGYGDLLDRLNPEDPKSEVDKVVKFILDKNIIVRHVNVMLSHISNAVNSFFYSKVKGLENLKTKRFSGGDFGDDHCLRKRWIELVEKVPIINPDQCIQDFSQLKNREVLKKRNVLGCFLGQDLPHARHCADVFQHACSLLTTFKSGKFSKEEDKIILEEAKKFGSCLSTWKSVILKLNRKDSHGIARRYIALTEERSLFRGMWSLSEDEVLLESLFDGKKEAGIDEIKSMSMSDFQLCSEKLNRSNRNVSNHWRNIVMPILLAHHCQTLHRPWRRDFFEYLIEKKVVAVQDIDYSKASSFWPEQCATSLKTSLNNYTRKQAEQNKPLFQIIQENLHSFKDIQETERVRNYREEIVRIYDEAKNRTI
jgi:hypothetical protein